MQQVWRGVAKGHHIKGHQMASIELGCQVRLAWSDLATQSAEQIAPAALMVVVLLLKLR
jgi:hypothetical protein